MLFIPYLYICLHGHSSVLQLPFIYFIFFYYVHISQSADVSECVCLLYTSVRRAASFFNKTLFFCGIDKIKVLISRT